MPTGKMTWSTGRWTDIPAAWRDAFMESMKKLAYLKYSSTPRLAHRLRPSKVRRHAWRGSARASRRQADAVIHQAGGADEQSQLLVPGGVEIKTGRQQPPDADLVAGEHLAVPAGQRHFQAQPPPRHQPVNREDDGEEPKKGPGAKEHGNRPPVRLQRAILVGQNLRCGCEDWAKCTRKRQRVNPRRRQGDEETRLLSKEALDFRA